MGYVILALFTVPFFVVFGFMLLIATGVFHERDETEEVAHNYRLSWKTAEHV